MLKDILFKPCIRGGDHAAAAHNGIINNLAGVDRVRYVLDAGANGSSGTVDVVIQEAALTTLVDDLYDAQDTGLVLNNGSGDNVSLAVAFTTPNHDGVAVSQIKAMFKQVGTVATGKKISCSIQAISSNVPSGTDLVTAVVGSKAPDALSKTAYEPVVFDFSASPVLLAKNTAYAVVFTADYDASSTNHTLLGIDTVASGGNIHIKDATWAVVVATQKGLVQIDGHDFVAIPSGESTASFAQVTEAKDNALYVLDVRVDPVKTYQRAVATVGTATCDFGVIAVSVPHVRPVTQDNTVVTV